MKKIITVLLMILMLLSGCEKKEVEVDKFTMWNKDGAINNLINYVEDVTDENSENYIPKEDRIAIFDLDGTLLCEHFPTYIEFMLYCYRVLGDKDYKASDELKDFGLDVLNAIKTNSINEELEKKEYINFGKVFDSMPVEEYKEYLKKFLEIEVDGFENMSFKDAYFRPMVEVLAYLEENDFIVYVCSGTDRDLDRVLMDGFYHLPYYQVIGTDCYNEGSKHDDVDYLEYQYDKDEVVIRDDTPIIKNIKSSKIAQIYQEIGQKPVLAFGNSTGDFSMFSYTASNDKYKTAIFCLLPDDDEREYANMNKVETLTKACKENGYYTVSMKDDFLTMFDDNVKKNPSKMDFTNSLIDNY